MDTFTFFLKKRRIMMERSCQIMQEFSNYLPIFLIKWNNLIIIFYKKRDTQFNFK